MDSKDMHVRICQEEMESLLNLKYRLDHEEAVASYAEKYQKLGWVLQTLDSQDGSDLGVNFGEKPKTRGNRLWEPGLSGPDIKLGVCTGKESGLMVLEVAKGLGESNLDQYGLWRAECIAALGIGLYSVVCRNRFPHILTGWPIHLIFSEILLIWH